MTQHAKYTITLYAYATKPKLTDTNLPPPSKKYARTLEDALIYANAHLFASSTLKEHFQEPLIKKLLQEESDKDSIAEKAYNIVSDNHFQKTTFAIDCTLVDGLVFPPYVQEGLLWLEQVVSKKDITANS